MKFKSPFLLVYGSLSLFCFVGLMGFLLYSYETISRPVPDVVLGESFPGDRILNDDAFATVMSYMFPYLYYVGRYQGDFLRMGVAWWVCNVSTSLLLSWGLAFLPAKVALDLFFHER